MKISGEISQAGRTLVDFAMCKNENSGEHIFAVRVAYIVSFESVLYGMMSGTCPLLGNKKIIEAHGGSTTKSIINSLITFFYFIFRLVW
jgi:hypothetical protein